MRLLLLAYSFNFTILHLEMKTTLSLFLIFQLLASSLSSTGGLRVIFEVGSFIHHFAHHVDGEHRVASLADFVDLHYSDHQHHEENHGEHENLPFHHHHHSDQTPTPQLLISFPAAAQLMVSARVESTFNPLICVDRQWHSSAHLDDIWEPPKA
jgi:hypothetical protein